VRWLVLVFNMSIPNEVSVFNRFKDIEGVLKFENGSRHQSHAPLGVNFSSAGKVLDIIYLLQNLEHVASSVKTYREILNFHIYR